MNSSAINAINRGMGAPSARKNATGIFYCELLVKSIFVCNLVSIERAIKVGSEGQ